MNKKKKRKNKTTKLTKNQKIWRILGFLTFIGGLLSFFGILFGYGTGEYLLNLVLGTIVGIFLIQESYIALFIFTVSRIYALIMGPLAFFLVQLILLILTVPLWSDKELAKKYKKFKKSFFENFLSSKG